MTKWKQWQTLFSWALKSLQMITTATKLKDVWSLEEILWQTCCWWVTLVLSDSVTPQTAAHQALPSLGFSRQEHWSWLPFPSLMHESGKWKQSEITQSFLILSNPMDCSLPGSSIHGIYQARVLEWVAISFSHTIWSLHKSLDQS